MSDEEDNEAIANLSKALKPLGSIMRRGSQASPVQFGSAEPNIVLRLLIEEKYRARKTLGDQDLANALGIILTQYDLGLIDLSWDAWKGTVVVVPKLRN
jgi:hypothetical protein